MRAIRAVLKLLWRQRRIAALSAPLMMLAVVGMGDSTEFLQTRPVGIPIAAFIVSTLIVALGVALFCAALRLFRFLPVIVALTWPLHWAGSSVLPNEGAVAAIWPMAVILFVGWSLFSLRVDAWLPYRRWITCARFRTRATPPAILNATVPGLGPVESYWGSLHDVRRDPEKPDVRHVRYAVGRGFFQEQTVTIQRRDDEGGRYHFIDDASPAIAPMTEGAFDVTIGSSDARGRRWVTMKRERFTWPVRMAFLEWLEDRAGEEADSIAAKLDRTCDVSGAGRDARFLQSQS